MEVEHYDPYSDTWALTCPALKYVTNFTATACHGKLYVIGSCAVKYNALTMQCYNPVIGEDDPRKHVSEGPESPVTDVLSRLISKSYRQKLD